MTMPSSSADAFARVFLPVSALLCLGISIWTRFMSGRIDAAIRSVALASPESSTVDSLTNVQDGLITLSLALAGLATALAILALTQRLTSRVASALALAVSTVWLLLNWVVVS